MLSKVSKIIVFTRLSTQALLGLPNWDDLPNPQGDSSYLLFPVSPMNKLS